MFKTFDSYIVGCYDTLNTGSDVSLYTTLWASKHLLNDTRNALSCDHDSERQKRDNKKVIPLALLQIQKRLQHYVNAIRSKKVLFSGGSVFQCEKEIQIMRHLISLSDNYISRCIGVSLGPFKTINAEKVCAKFLNECGFIGVRDQQSLDMAKALAPNANIRLTFDLAPLMLCHNANKITSIERKGIMFNFCQPDSEPSSILDLSLTRKRLLEAVDTIKDVWNETNEPIYLVDLNGHPKSGDFHIHDQIMARVPETIPLSHISYDSNPFRVLQRIAGFKAVVSMRLHGNILSFLTKTPAVSISYHNKCDSWCKQIGVPEQYRLDAHYICPITVATILSKGLSTGFVQPKMTIAESINSAKLNWSQ